MTDAQPPRGLARLSEMFSVLGSLIVSDEHAAQYDQWNSEAASLVGRRQRKERLAKLDLEPKLVVYQGIVDGDLKPHPESPGASLLAVKGWQRRTDPRRKRAMILVGQNGCGKTAACMWLAANTEGLVAWMSAADLVRLHSWNSDDANRTRRKLRRAKLAIIDDVAAELDAEKMCAALVELFDWREQRDTAMTTNLGPAAWHSRFTDPRLHSRLKDAEFVPDHGPDLRGTT